MKYPFAMLFVKDNSILSRAPLKAAINSNTFARNMSTTNYHIASQRKSTTITAAFFLVIATLLLTGFLPQYLSYIDAECIELSESLEDESEGEKNEKEKETEKETDKYNTHLMLSALDCSNGLLNPDGHFHKWQNPSADIITPPPDFI